MKKCLVVVESPTKAKIISKFLPKEFEVVASYGHIRDLPVNRAELPEKLRKKNMEVVGVVLTDDKIFEPVYIVTKGKKKVVEELRKREKQADEVYIATDEDREGESIGWHIVDELKVKKEVRRLAFHEITKKAILDALQKPRSLDLNLVKAQEARRILDRLYGYLVSPLLWRKITKGLSAGRVQSVALRLLVEREEERMKFKSARYFSVDIELEKEGKRFEGKLTRINGKEVVTGKHFDPETGKLLPAKDVVLLDEAEANSIVSKILGNDLLVSAVDTKQVRLKTPSPFVTSVLQQEANKRFSFSPKYTMSLAQRLYENGFITYMRTDSTSLSEEAVSFIRDYITKSFGENYLSPQIKVYKSSVKNAQEAHEAIRPIVPFQDPAEIEKKLGQDARKLYELILRRTLASQMQDAQLLRTAVTMTFDNYEFRSTGTRVTFDGYLKIFDNNPEKEIPSLSPNEKIAVFSAKVTDHQTQPPARYTEGTLVRELEKRGIGRPSTWASIVDLVTKREYAFKKNGSLIPTFVSFAIVRLLRQYFPELVDYEFTARMEDALDDIAAGKLDYNEFLQRFYYGDGNGSGLKCLLEKNLGEVDSKQVCTIPVVEDEFGTFWVRVGKNGAYLTDSTRYVRLSPETPPDQLRRDYCLTLLENSQKTFTLNGCQVSEKFGKYGRYLEIENDSGVKRLSLNWLKNAQLSEDLVRVLCSLPKELGFSEKLDAHVSIEIGKYGPYLKAGSRLKTISIEKIADLNINSAEEILLKSSSFSKLLGYDEKGVPVYLKKGRYGCYLKVNSTNISLKNVSVEDLNLEKALELIKSRAK
ncbi:MAG: type I DNA topoisomerase [Deltaproteobacteria bacterium]|nr:type I DNA topoisomerase [Deltaproteobacteria bacterium]MCX7953492.1 type I DNA topoisomerase [Deltaproteobacteria bacterium]